MRCQLRKSSKNAPGSPGTGGVHAERAEVGEVALDAARERRDLAAGQDAAQHDDAVALEVSNLSFAGCGGFDGHRA